MAEQQHSVNSSYDELLLDFNRDNSGVLSATVMKVVRENVVVAPTTADHLNLQCGNSKIAYLPKGKYKKSDEIPAKTLKTLSPHHPWKSE